ncbi:MAG: adenosine kinase, partial [Pseudomonadota bacterium]
GDDAFGDRFIADLQASNIAWFGKNMALQTITESERAGTGRCLVLISDDGQRSMCTWLGCAGLLHEGDVDQQAIAASRSLYLEGYLFDLPASKEAFFKAARIAREHKTVAALTLSDSFCVGRHREDFLHLIGQGIDILFANELEAMMLTETSDQKAMLAAIAECAPIVCVTLSEEGSILINRGTQHRIMAWHAGPLQDSTGAGDQYAAGFLFGQAQGWDLVRCGELASRLAGHTVTQYGARCEGEQIAAIRRDFAHIS